MRIVIHEISFGSYMMGTSSMTIPMYDGSVDVKASIVLDGDDKPVVDATYEFTQETLPDSIKEIEERIASLYVNQIKE